MILLCIAIMWYLLQNEFVQRKIAKPISRMSHAMNTLLLIQKRDVLTVSIIFMIFIFQPVMKLRLCISQWTRLLMMLLFILTKWQKNVNFEEDLEIAKRTSEAKSTSFQHEP